MGSVLFGVGVLLIWLELDKTLRLQKGNRLLVIFGNAMMMEHTLQKYGMSVDAMIGDAMKNVVGN